MQDVHLHLVGDGPTLPALRTLVSEAGLSDRVHFHGAVPVAGLGPFYEGAHVAIGSLAPHRVGLRELAALKHREYVLRGIPMVLARGGPLESISAARFVDPGDATALAALVVAILGSGAAAGATDVIVVGITRFGTTDTADQNGTITAVEPWACSVTPKP